MATGDSQSFEVKCPCCGAQLTLDARLKKVLSSRRASEPVRTRDLDHPERELERETVKREALFEQSVEQEKGKAELLERKFEEALKRARGKPAPPLRDSDLD